MAFTVTTVVNGVPGNMRLWQGRVTPDATTGVVTVPGATYVDGLLCFDIVGGTASLTCCTVTPNLNASGVAAAGNIGFSNVVASTIYNVAVLYH